MSQDPCFLINVFGKQECNHHWRGKGIHFMSAKWPPWSRSSCLAPVYLAISSHLAMSLSFEMTRYRKSPRDRTLWACGSFRARLCHTEGFVIISCYLAVTNLFMLQLRSKYLLIAYHHPSKYNCTMGIGLWSMLHWSTHAVQL